MDLRRPSRRELHALRIVGLLGTFGQSLGDYFSFCLVSCEHAAMMSMDGLEGLGGSLQPTGFDVHRFRTEFPALDGWTCFNDGFEGLMSRASHQAVMDAVAHKFAHGRSQHDNLSINAERDELRTLFAESINAPPSSIALTNSATLGLGTLLLGFVEPGDVVVTSVGEHDALALPLARLKRLGATVHSVPLRNVGQAARLLENDPNTRGRVKVVASIVGWDSGQMLDPLVRTLRLPTILDAAQSAGVLPFDASTWGPSTAYVTSSHKHYQGMVGGVPMYISPELTARIETVLPNEWSHEGRERIRRAETKAGAHPFDSDATSPIAVSGTLAAMKLLRSYGMAELGQRAVTMARQLERELRKHRFDVIDRDDSTLVVWHDDHARSTSRCLFDEFGVVVRHIDKALHRGPVVRASVGPWTTAKDIEQLVASIVTLRDR